MTLLARALAVAVAALSPAAACAAPNPVSIIRTFQVLQEQVAHGNAAAQAAQPKLMAHVADEFLAADPDVWKDPRNARAAAIFLLSGGRPSVIRQILEKATMAPETDRLIQGALAYGEGSDDAARALLGSIDAKSLPPMLGGHLALVQASLLPEADEAKARALLDTARLLVPGTLVEEAALRRQMFLLTSPASIGKFVFLARQYIRRYRTSIYAPNFKQRLDEVVRKLAGAGDVASLDTLDAVLAEYPTAERTGFYLSIAKTAIVQGQAVAARYGAEKAATLVGDKGEAGARSALYAGAALVASDDAGKGVAALRDLDRDKLSAADAELRDAALAVAAAVRAEPAATGAPPADSAASSGVVAQAEAALARTGKLLGGDKTP